MPLTPGIVKNLPRSNSATHSADALLHLPRDLHPERLKYGPALHSYRASRVTGHLGYLTGNMSSATAGDLSQKDASKYA
jgi:hypothetical protein